MTFSERAVEEAAKAIVAAEYDDEFYPFETSSRAEQELARRQARVALTAALAVDGVALVPSTISDEDDARSAPQEQR